eukprot:8720340-Heterocapsa_arctica.AAC.1
MDSLNEFQTYDHVPEEEAAHVWADKSATVVKSRWVRIKKADGRTKCRLVAQQINYGEKMDTYAATASSAGARLLLALAAHPRGRGERWTLQLGDVSTAFLHAPLPPDRNFYVVPPSTEEEGGA